MKAVKQNSAVESTPAFDTDHTIKTVDPELWRAIERENRRQHDHIELIASENYVSPAVMQAQGSQLTNKYAEGYPGRLSLPKTIFERIDGVGRLESDRRQCPRTARSDVYRACPSQAQRGFAPHYNNSRISQGFAEGAQH